MHIYIYINIYNIFIYIKVHSCGVVNLVKIIKSRTLFFYEIHILMLCTLTYTNHCICVIPLGGGGLFLIFVESLSVFSKNWSKTIHFKPFRGGWLNYECNVFVSKVKKRRIYLLYYIIIIIIYIYIYI